MWCASSSVIAPHCVQAHSSRSWTFFFTSGHGFHFSDGWPLPFSPVAQDVCYFLRPHIPAALVETRDEFRSFRDSVIEAFAVLIFTVTLFPFRRLWVVQYVHHVPHRRTFFSLATLPVGFLHFQPSHRVSRTKRCSQRCPALQFGSVGLRRHVLEFESHLALLRRGIVADLIVMPPDARQPLSEQDDEKAGDSDSSQHVWCWRPCVEDSHRNAYGHKGGITRRWSTTAAPRLRFDWFWFTHSFQCRPRSPAGGLVRSLRCRPDKTPPTVPLTTAPPWVAQALPWSLGRTSS